MDVVEALVVLSYRIQKALAEVGAAHDLSLIQIRLLGILRDRQPGMLELGAYLGLDKSSMTGLVQRAEKRGLVRRDPSPHDGRAVLVSLTDAGRALAAEGEAEIAASVRAIAARLGPDDQKELVRLVSALIEP